MPFLELSSVIYVTVIIYVQLRKMYPCHCVLDRVLCTTLTFWLKIYWSFSGAIQKKNKEVLEGLIIRKLYILKPKRTPCIYYALNESDLEFNL